jgi:hypothetical protein
MSLSQEKLPEAYADEKATSLELPAPIRRRKWYEFGGQDYSFVSVNAGYPLGGSAASSDTNVNEFDAVAKHGIYETEEAREIYKPIEKYEGAHRFKPDFVWEPEEERKLVRRVSVCLILYIDVVSGALLPNLDPSSWSLGNAPCAGGPCSTSSTFNFIPSSPSNFSITEPTKSSISRLLLPQC